MDECVDISGSEEEELGWHVGGDGERACVGDAIKKKAN